MVPSSRFTLDQVDEDLYNGTFETVIRRHDPCPVSSRLDSTRPRRTDSPIAFLGSIFTHLHPALSPEPSSLPESGYDLESRLDRIAHGCQPDELVKGRPTGRVEEEGDVQLWV